MLCGVCAVYASDSGAGSCDCLAQGCRCGGFFPNSVVFELVLGISVLDYGILALALIFLGCAYGVAFLAPSTYPMLRPLPAVAGFVVFTAALLSGGPWGCVVVLSGAAELYPISTLPEHIHSTILSYHQNYLKTHTQTMETSFHPPLTLVSLLTNYPHSHYLPPHWESHLHSPLYSHSIFWRHGSNVSCAASCTFVLFAFCFGSKVTGIYHASLLETLRDWIHVLITMRSVFYVFSWKWGWGVMDLVYDSSLSSYMDCKMFFGDECFHFRRSGVRLDQCSCVGGFIVGLIIFGSYFYGSATFRMSTRRLPVILFVFRFEYPFISCCLLRGVPVVAGGDFYFVCVQELLGYAWHVSNLRLFHSLLLIIILPPPPWALQQPHHSRLC